LIIYKTGIHPQNHVIDHLNQFQDGLGNRIEQFYQLARYKRLCFVQPLFLFPVREYTCEL
jgi:hypothetical protein